MDILLYRASASNSSERVEWALNYKKIRYQKVEVTDEQLRSSYLSINPFGYVPSLAVDGVIISESMAILEYLEEGFPAYPLLGGSAQERANVRRVCEFVNSTVHSPQNRSVLKFLRPDLTEESKRELRGLWITQCLEKLSQTICLASPYVVGDHFTLADIFVATIYKKARQHGASELAFYRDHLLFLRSDRRVAMGEPK